MDQILKNNVKSVQKLNDKAGKGSIKNLYSRIEIGKLCLEGYTYWKANKKELKVTRDELVKAYGYGKTYFGDLRKAATVQIEDVERYIADKQSKKAKGVYKNNEYSIRELLNFLKDTPTPDKVPNMFNYAQAKTDDDKGLSARVDADLILHTKSDLNELLDSMHCMVKVVEAALKAKELATIELKEVVEA